MQSVGREVKNREKRDNPVESVVTFRLSLKDRKIYEAIADIRGVSLAELIRKALSGQYSKESEQLKSLLG